MISSKKSKITDENRKEAERLKAIWNASTSKPSQAVFAEEYDLGTQGNVGHYLNARSPINPKAATAFAHLLGCQVSDFSPRVAMEIASLAIPSGDSAAVEWDIKVAWPFDPTIVSRERYMALPSGIRVLVQGALRRAIDDEEARLTKQGAPQKAVPRAA